MHKKTLQELAGKIRDFLRAKNIELGQREALELLARLRGFKDLHQSQSSKTVVEPPDDLSTSEKHTLNNLRERGFAIVIYNPKELGPVSPTVIEDRLREYGGDMIPIADIEHELNANGDYEIPGTDEILTLDEHTGTITRKDKNLTILESRCPRDPVWEDWAAHFGKGFDDYRWFLNHYTCPQCKVSWTDEHDCTCNDRCPECNAEFEPELSEELDPNTGKVIDPDVNKQTEA